jgi:hypothetical protein
MRANGYGDQTAEVWLLLYDYPGRYFLPRELAPMLPASVNETQVSRILQQMAIANRCKRAPRGMRYAYGMTKDCCIPTTLTLADLARLGAVKETA